MKLAFFSSLLCIIVRIGLIVGAGIAYPLINSPLSNLETRITNILSQTSNSVSIGQKTINATQVTLEYLSSTANISLPALSRTSQLTSTTADNLTYIASTISEAGQTLSSTSIAGTTPFVSLGNTIASISQPIQTAANNLQNVSASIGSTVQQANSVPGSLNTITLQVSYLNGSLTGLKSSVIDLQNSVSSYFSLIRLGVILGLVALGGLGTIFLLIGLSISSLRRRAIHR